MSLSAADRKNLSKKYVGIPDENAAAAINITNLDILIDELQSLDGSYKNLFDGDNSLVDFYHPEINYLEGQVRTSITETDIQNSAKKTLGNFFFPNNPQVTTPFLTDGIWKEFKAYAKNLTVGKNYQEVYVTQDSENDKITAVNLQISYILATYSSSELQTGVDDTIGPFNLAADLADLESKVNDWESYLNGEKTALLANTDSQETGNILAAIINVNGSLAQIAAWEALPDYAVNGKLDGTGLAILTNEVAVRPIVISSRITEIDTRLGTVTQNSDGSIASFSGLYGARYINTDSRINLATGTLSKQTGLELGKRVQEELITDNDNYLQYLHDNVLIATKLSANANGTNIITVDDATDFSISDTVYIVSETQTEVTGTISGISGTVITLSFDVSEDFTISDLSRLLKQV